MLICNCCGNLIEDYELKKTYQCHGYTSLGQPLEEEIDECCSCGGEYVRASKCKICGEWFDNEDLYGICEGCLEEYETVGTALEIGENDTTSVEINGFVASVLSAEQINKILAKWVEENFTDHSRDVVKYCEEDKAYFSDYLADKYAE